MDRFESLTGNWVFTLSRWLGSTPWDKYGEFSAVRAAYILFVAISVNVCYVLVRWNEIDYMISLPDPYILIRLFVSFSVHLSHMIPSLTWAGQCWTKRRSIKAILTQIRATNVDSDSAVLFWCVLAQLFIGLWRMCTDTPFWIRTGITMSSTLLQLISLTIVIQFRSILGALCDKMLNLCGLVEQNQIDVNMHHELIKVAKSLIRVYEVQMLLALVQIFLTVTVYPYYGFAFFEAPGSGQFDVLAWYLYYLGNVGIKMALLLLIASRCHRFSAHAEAFNNELFKLMRSNRELCRDSKLFLYVTMKQTVKFTACGFFNLGYPLVTSIIAAATTYLVILLQFSMPTN